MEPRTYQILLKNHRFEPEQLHIEKGSIVEWRVVLSTSSDNSSDDPQSDYDDSTRHVIAFECAPLALTESPLLKVNQTFRVRFLETGDYPYRCQIYPRTRGFVRVHSSSSLILSPMAMQPSSTKQIK
jgi:plastocyanin